MQKFLKTWFTAMKECIPTLVLYKYYDPDFTLAITNPSEISTNVGIRPRSKGDLWFQIYAGFNREDDEVKDNTEWWFANNQSAMYRK